MRLALAHRWDLTTAEARDLQVQLRERLVLAPPADLRMRRVAGADLSMSKFSSRGFGGMVVLDAAALEPVARAAMETKLTFPYVPGLLSFREAPAVASALLALPAAPDVVFVDGQGLAHPRRFGIACHLGLLLDLPTLGCAKSRLVGTHADVPNEAGAWVPLVDRGEEIGAVLRTRTGVKPLYVSIGHRLSLATVVSLVLAACQGRRLPEPTRRADALASRR